MHSHCVGKLLVLFLFAALALSGGAKTVYAQYPGFDAPSQRVSGGGAIGLVPVNPTVDGGSIPMGATAQVVVLFRNEGAQPVQTGKINLYPSSTVSAEVTLNQCQGEALQSGAECAIAISVKGMQSGPWRVEMLMLHSGRSRLVTSTLSGSVDASGDSADKLSSDIETIPDEIDFGALASSQTMIESVVLRNVTSNPIDVSNIAINAADTTGFTVEHECETLAAGQACIATLRWKPKQKGPATGVLVVKHSGPAGLVSVPITGDYAPDSIDQAEIFPDAVPGRGLLVSSQTEVDFGDSVTAASTITVSLVNTGDSPLTLKDIKLSGSDNGLSLNSNGCSADMVLAPIEACPLTLTWSPTRIGELLDDIQVIHDGARGVLVLPVRGEAENTVSQDQKAIVLSNSSSSSERSAPTKVVGQEDVATSPSQRKNSSKRSTPIASKAEIANAVSALDGLKITSFAKTRAIVNGPGGSRLIFHGEPVMLGGVTWDVHIQHDGIEFENGEDRVLLLFDRSLSSINRLSANSSSSSSSSE